MSEAPRVPAEQLPVTLFDAVVLAVRSDDGEIALALRDLTQSLGLSRSAQVRRIQSHDVLREGLRTYVVETGGGRQEQEFLALDSVPLWLVTIQASRVMESARPRLVWFQRYAREAVNAAFEDLTGLPVGSSQQIEDLDDLRRIAQSLDAMVERQQSIEQSQDRARLAWRELRDEIRALSLRLNTLEKRVGGTISREQKGYLYHLVQAWGAARAERDARLTQRQAHATCWTAFKLRFGVARGYEDLPSERFGEAVAWVREQYRALTGTTLDLPGQSELDLGE